MSFQSSLTLGNPFQDLKHPFCTDPAWRTLAAGFVLNEIEEESGKVDHAGIFIGYDEAARSDYGPELGHRFIINGYIEML